MWEKVYIFADIDGSLINDGVITLEDLDANPAKNFINYVQSKGAIISLISSRTLEEVFWFAQVLETNGLLIGEDGATLIENFNLNCWNKYSVISSSNNIQKNHTVSDDFWNNFLSEVKNNLVVSNSAYFSLKLITNLSNYEEISSAIEVRDKEIIARAKSRYGSLCFFNFPQKELETLNLLAKKYNLRCANRLPHLFSKNLDKGNCILNLLKHSQISNRSIFIAIGDSLNDIGMFSTVNQLRQGFSIWLGGEDKTIEIDKLLKYPDKTTFLPKKYSHSLLKFLPALELKITQLTNNSI